MYCISGEIDEDFDSDIIDESDEESDLEGFIVPDDEIDGQVIHQVLTEKLIESGMIGNQPAQVLANSKRSLIRLKSFKMHADNLNF